VIRKQALGTLDALTAVAPRDADSLARATGLEVTVIPNGVELTETSTDSGQRELLVVFTGAMDFPPNETAACYLARHVWPLVLQRYRRHPDQTQTNTSPSHAERRPKLAIVGADPTPKVRRLADLQGVIVTGRVEDVSLWLKRAQIAAAPMVSGCGIKNKVLEACAAACPVVTTPLGAAGLPTGSDHGIIVAATPERIADEIATLLAHPSKARAIGEAGQDMVRTQFSWPGSAQMLLGILQGVARIAPPAIHQNKPGQSEQTGFEPALSRMQPNNEEALSHAAS